VALPLLDALGQAVQAELALPVGRVRRTAPTFGLVTPVSRAQRNASSGVAGSDVRPPRSRRATPLATAALATASATDSATRRLKTLGMMYLPLRHRVLHHLERPVDLARG
jgi:hypothetical protein